MRPISRRSLFRPRAGPHRPAERIAPTAVARVSLLPRPACYLDSAGQDNRSYPRGSTLVDEPPHALEYASPTTPRQPFRLRSRHVAYATGTFAVLAAIFIPDTVGSGVVQVNPLAALACFAIMGGAIIYVWMRLFEEGPRSPRLAAFVGTCATIAILALPFQFWTLANDYGEPRPWVRLKLYAPGIIVLTALVLAAIGRRIIYHCSGPRPRNVYRSSIGRRHGRGQ